MESRLFYLVLGAVAFGFSSCVPSTPASRIEARPVAFERLSEREKSLVERGEISEGMSKEAVSLAWGSPDGRSEALRGGKKVERWDYVGTRPVVVNQFNAGFRGGRWCNGYGGWGCGGFGGGGFGFGPSVIYVPQRTGSVLFRNERVDEWERIR